MKITYLHIKNFKSIRDLEIKEIDNALILVGKNNTGKTGVIDAIRVASGKAEVHPGYFIDADKNISITMRVEFDEKDLFAFHTQGKVSKYKKYDLWEKDFCAKLPSYQDGTIEFECIIRKDGSIRYNDGVKKNNTYIKEVFPKVYHIDHTRDRKSVV